MLSCSRHSRHSQTTSAELPGCASLLVLQLSTGSGNRQLQRCVALVGDSAESCQCSTAPSPLCALLVHPCWPWPCSFPLPLAHPSRFPLGSRLRVQTNLARTLTIFPLSPNQHPSWPFFVPLSPTGLDLSTPDFDKGHRTPTPKTGRNLPANPPTHSIRLDLFFHFFDPPAIFRHGRLMLHRRHSYGLVDTIDS